MREGWTWTLKTIFILFYDMLKFVHAGFNGTASLFYETLVDVCRSVECYVVFVLGRVARAGRSGTAYSLIAPEEMSYVIDLHLFLGRPLKYAEHGKKHTGWCSISWSRGGCGFYMLSSDISIMEIIINSIPN